MCTAAAAPAGRREGAIPTGEKKVELENGLRWKVSEGHKKGAESFSGMTVCASGTRMPAAAGSPSVSLHLAALARRAGLQVDFVTKNKAEPLHLDKVEPKQDIYIYAAQEAVIYVDTKARTRGQRGACGVVTW